MVVGATALALAAGHADLASEMILVGSLVVVGAMALALAAGAEAAVVDLEAA